MPFKIALEKTGLNPEEIIIVGDRSDEDIYGAKLLGMKTVKIKNPHPTFGETREADYEMQDLIELKEALKSKQNSSIDVFKSKWNKILG